MRLVLVHSPYLGPLSWEPTANRLRAMGYDVEVPDLRGSLREGPCVPSFIAATGAAIDHTPTGRTPSGRAVVVGHSRAGPFLPAAANGCPAVAGLLYVDAALPHPGRSWADQAPPGRIATMRQKVVAGRLPRWSEWWDDPGVIERLVPDPTLRSRLVDEMPCVPGSLLDERLPNLDWRGMAGYIQLSSAYAAFADAAQGAGWPVERRALDHLAILSAPADVASSIATMLTVLTPAGE